MATAPERQGDPHCGEVSGIEDELAIARLVTEHAAEAIILLDSEGRTTFANPAAEEMFGWSFDELKGRELHDLIHYQHPDGCPFPMAECPLVKVFATGRSLRLHEDLFYHKDGSAVPVTCSNAAISREGKVVGGVLVVRDVTERKRAEVHRQLLINELNHRVKNTLAIVQGIAQQTFKGEGLRRSRAAFEGRLAALSDAHNLLTDSGWDTVSLKDVVGRTVRPFASEERVRLTGPDIRLGSKASVALALAIHELSTNATKYGALSVEGGRVSVDWTFAEEQGEPMLRLVWRETGGPAVSKPSRRGFGSRMLERGLAAELNGSVNMAFEPAGLRCSIEASLPSDG